MSSYSQRMRNAQRYDKLRDLMAGRVEKAVGRPLHPSERLFVSHEVDQMIHRGDSSEPSLVALAKQIKSMSSNGPTSANDARQNASRENLAPLPPSGGSVVSSAVNGRSSGVGVGVKKHGAGSAVSSTAPTSSVLVARRIADNEVRELHDVEQRARADARAQRQQVKRDNAAAAGVAYAGGHSGSQIGAGSSKKSRKDQAGSNPILTSVDSRNTQHRRPLPHEEHKDDLWAAIAKKEAEEFFAENLTHRRVAKTKADEQRLVLDQQVALRKQKVVDAREAEKKYVVEAERQKVLWEQEEKQVVAERKRRIDEEHHTREEQLSVNRDRRAAEIARRKIEGERAVAAAAAQVEEEQRVVELRKIRSKEEVAQFHKFNEESKKLRDTEVEKERLRDEAAEKTYLERLAKEEAEREASLKKMFEKMKIKEQIAFQIESTWKDKAVADEARAKAYAEKIEQRKDEEERAAKQKALDAKVRQRQYLQIQMLERDNRTKTERDRFESERAGAKLEAELAEKAEHERRVRDKMKLTQHREDLERQMLQHASRREELMTDTEKKLNRRHLAQAGCSA